jgi:hypothetical protein
MIRDTLSTINTLHSVHFWEWYHLELKRNLINKQSEWVLWFQHCTNLFESLHSLNERKYFCKWRLKEIFEKNRKIEDTGRRLGLICQHFCMICRSICGQSLGIVGVNPLSLCPINEVLVVEFQTQNEH